ncbi:proline-rich receptor-like protein kinase PERK2 [Iris pallida]|uniref:Proline-rich receptor-like protein kinase PERK2 n=1 Tax=Iris pallida TaxID=29817 RepID=A0AAX6G3Q8_IRIPA|nr:proline-rich receptor-like protein kinase PERK2 [Iris pallida]KAJ6853385.1 proline-rich receptor-like protein kinase PERK2 [Iris pallida]
MRVSRRPSDGSEVWVLAGTGGDDRCPARRSGRQRISGKKVRTVSARFAGIECGSVVGDGSERLGGRRQGLNLGGALRHGRMGCKEESARMFLIFSIASLSSFLSALLLRRRPETDEEKAPSRRRMV